MGPWGDRRCHRSNDFDAEKPCTVAFCNVAADFHRRGPVLLFLDELGTEMGLS